MIEIDRQFAGEAVDRPWSTQAQFVLSNAAVDIPFDLSTIKLFGQAGQFLLVLGDPGRARR
jgi:hypothetical protein